MANSRNQVDNILSISGPKVPRYIHTTPTAVHLGSNKHGNLSVCFCTPVLANESITFDSNIFCRADTSARVPLDDVFADVYYFYVPYRFLDENFVKVLGDKHPLDDTEYAFPQIEITDITPDGTYPTFLPFDLGWSFVQPETAGEGETQIKFSDSFNAYFLMAYWKIYNDFFRDENLDVFIDIDQLKDISLSWGEIRNVYLEYLPDGNSLERLFYEAPVNRLSDIYSRSLISPQYGDAHRIPGADFAWLDSTTNPKYFSVADNMMTFLTGDDDPTTGPLGLTEGLVGIQDMEEDEYSDAHIIGSNLGIKLRESLGTIQELSVSMMLQAMDFARATHGHRYIETLEALWGSSMPDYLVGRAEYLGGITTTLNNIPVLSNEAATLGLMAGNSASLFNDGGFTKTFPEPGVVLGVYTTRIYHKFSQGKAHYLNYRNLMDIPNVYVAEMGPMPLMQSELANMGSRNKDKVFSFSKSWIHERIIDNCVGGVFNPNTFYPDSNGDDVYAEFKKLWDYIDVYEHNTDYLATEGLPTFNAEWLKEPTVNVARTMTGRLLPYASDATTNCTPQYLFAFYQHCKRTNFLPGDPDPLWYIRRL